MLLYFERQDSSVSGYGLDNWGPVLFGIRKNSHSSGRNLLYLFVKWVIKLSSNYRQISLLPTT